MYNEEERKQMVHDQEKEIMDCNENAAMRRHVHVYNTMTDVSCCHQHVFLGVSSPAEISGTSHIHRLCVRTSFMVHDDVGHWHWVDIMTGRAIAMPDGTHIHYFAGHTSTNERHCHEFSDVTNLGPDLCVMNEEQDIPIQKPCKYKYNRVEEEYN